MFLEKEFFFRVGYLPCVILKQREKKNAQENVTS